MHKTFYYCDICNRQVKSMLELSSVIIQRPHDHEIVDEIEVCKDCNKNINAMINGMKKKD